MNIRKIIRDEKERQGITTYAFAEGTGIGKSTMYKCMDLKNKTGNPTCGNIEKMLEFLGGEIVFKGKKNGK